MPDPAPDKKASEKPRRGGKARGILFFLIAAGVAPFILPSLLICVGLLPTLVALINDRDWQKSSAMTIGFMNIAGVAPFLLDLWQQGQTMEAALHILGQQNTWLIMFGAAGVGKLILYAVPTAVATLTLTRMEVRLRALKAGLEQLKVIWGPDVATTAPIDQIRKKEVG